jgi:ubiquinone/menaquinone biosynthesis C-methylase UbiE
MNGQNPDIERFNRWSASYDQSVFQRLFFGPVQRTVLSMADLQSEPATIVDVGCGTGRLLRSAKERWPTARLIGVDPSEGMIEIARKLNPHAEFYIAPAEAIPLADVSVDLAFSTISFHHWSNQLGGIREIARILRPGGCFILADQIADQNTPIWIRILFSVLHSFHRSTPRLSEIQKMFEVSGLQIIRQNRISFGLVAMVAGIRNDVG